MNVPWRKTALAMNLSAAVVLAFLAPSASFAQGTKQRPSENSDADLLKELEADLLQDLPSAKTPKDSAGKGATQRSAGDQQLLNDLREGEDLGSQPENPLLRIGKQMRMVQERIGKQDISEETQTAQSDIVAELQRLIEQAQQQNNQQNKGASGRGTGKAGVGDGQATPGAPQDSTDRVGKPQTQTPQAADVRNLLERIWGHLPEKTRDEMRNALGDQFLPKYERLIEEYYKRLAEERPGSQFEPRQSE